MTLKILKDLGSEIASAAIILSMNGIVDCD